MKIYYILKRKIRNFLCNLKAVPAFLDTGWWLPHSYVEITPMYSDKIIKDVYVSNHGIRIKYDESTLPNPDEILIKDAPIKRYICKKCGKNLIIFDNTYGMINK